MPEVRLLGGLRELIGETSLISEASSVRALIDEIAARGGPAVALLLHAENGIAPNRDLRILVNGRSVEFLAGLETVLRAEDAVTLHFAGARGYPGG